MDELRQTDVNSFAPQDLLNLSESTILPREKLTSAGINGEPIPEAEEITEPKSNDEAVALSDHPADGIVEETFDVMETADNTTAEEAKELEAHEAAENQSKTSAETLMTNFFTRRN